MSLKQDIVNESSSLIGELFHQSQEKRLGYFFLYALNERIKDLSTIMYNLYSYDFKLNKELSSKELDEKEELYKEQLNECIEKFNKDYFASGGYCHFYFGEISENHSKFRIYCNIKVNQIFNFMQTIMFDILPPEKPSLFNKKKCLCGIGNLTYDTKKRRFNCSNEKCLKIKDFTYFTFKINDPRKGATFGNYSKLNEKEIKGLIGFEEHLKDWKQKMKYIFLRKEKFVFYSSNETMYKWLLREIARVSNNGSKYFSKLTPALTHKVFSGCGVTFSPNEEENKIHKDLIKEELYGIFKDQKISFGELISGILAESFILAVKKDKKKIIKYLQEIKNSKNKEDLIENLKNEVLINFVAELMENERLEHFIERFKELKRISKIS